MKIVFKCEQYNSIFDERNDRPINEIEFITYSEELPSILLEFQRFLSAVGFSTKGVLDFREEEE